MLPNFVIRNLGLLASGIALWPSLAVAAPQTEPLASFQTEKQAQEHCPAGLVVWLDIPTKLYYFRGQQKYGATQNGAYRCRDEAKSAGMRPAYPKLSMRSQTHRLFRLAQR